MGVVCIVVVGGIVFYISWVLFC